MKILPFHQARTSVDVDAVTSALNAVEDPEIHQSLTSLGMVSSIEVKPSGVVRVKISLTTASCPMRGRLLDDVTEAVRKVPGVSHVDVGFEVMDEQRRLWLAQHLRKRHSRHAPRGFGSTTKVYAVASGKGGVGKSSITANLAVALAQSGKTVGVLDGDVWGYSIPRLFGVRRNPVAMHGMMLPLEAHGVRLISTGFLVDDDAPVIWRGPMLHKALEQFLDDVYWGELDVLLLDLPPGTGDIMLSLLELVPGVQLLIVTTPQPAAQNVALRVGKMGSDMRVPIAGAIENMSHFVCPCCGERSAMFGTGGGARLANTLNVPLLGRVPLDVALRESGDVGKPVVVRAPDSPSAQELRRIASQLPSVQRSLAGVPLPLSVVAPTRREPSP